MDEKQTKSKKSWVIKDVLKKNEFITSRELFKVKTYIYLLGFSLGLFYLIDIPTYYIEKDQLYLSSVLMNTFTSIITLPYSIKPLLAFLVDSIKLKLGFKKIIILISIIDIFLLFFIYYLNLHKYMFLVFLIFHQIIMVICLIIAETIIIIISKKINKNEVNDDNNTLLSSFFISRNVGILLGNFFSGRLIKMTNSKFVILLSSAFSVLMIWVTLFFDENVLKLKNRQNNNINNFFTDIKKVLRIFNNKKILILTVFVFVLNSCPSYDSDFKNFLTDHLKFDETTMSNLNTISLIFYIFGLSCYNLFFSKVNYKIFYSVTNFILLLLMFGNLILTQGYNRALGINDLTFAILGFGLTSFFSELNFIPILCICMDLCPLNLEATTFSFFTSIFNFSGNVALLLGSLCSKMVNLNTKNYSNFWQLIIIQGFYYFLFMIVLFFIEFPKKKIDNQENQENLENQENN